MTFPTNELLTFNNFFIFLGFICVFCIVIALFLNIYIKQEQVKDANKKEKDVRKPKIQQPKLPVPKEKLPIIEIDVTDSSGKSVKRKYRCFNQYLPDGSINQFLFPVDEPGDKNERQNQDKRKQNQDKAMFVLTFGSIILTVVLTIILSSQT